MVALALVVVLMYGWGYGKVEGDDGEEVMGPGGGLMTWGDTGGGLVVVRLIRVVLLPLVGMIESGRHCDGCASLVVVVVVVPCASSPVVALAWRPCWRALADHVLPMITIVGQLLYYHCLLLLSFVPPPSQY